MEQREHGRGRLVVLGGALLMVATFLIVWGASSVQRALAEPHPGVNFDMAVPGYPGCNTNNGDTQCNLPPGARFTLNVTLGALPSDVPSYEGYDIKLSYTGLTSADNASTAMWPDCAFPAAAYDTGLVNMGCAIGIDASPSTYTGVVGTNGFTCSQSGTGTITMEHGAGATDLIENLTTILSEPGAAETLNITCGTPPTPTLPTTPTAPTATPRAAAATPTALPRLVSTGSGGSPGRNGRVGAELWLLVGSLLALSGVAFTSWKFAQRR